MLGAGKVLMAQPSGRADMAGRIWWMAHYFLFKNSRSYMYYSYSTTPYWWAEYEIDIGDYIEEPPLELDDLKRPSGIYARPHTEGLVLVNPTNDPITEPLDQTYQEVTFSGFGPIVDNTRPDVTVGRGASHSGSVTVPGNSALILITSP